MTFTRYLNKRRGMMRVDPMAGYTIMQAIGWLVAGYLIAKFFT